jgi:hypothetical protein
MKSSIRSKTDNRFSQLFNYSLLMHLLCNVTALVNIAPGGDVSDDHKYFFIELMSFELVSKPEGNQRPSRFHAC